MYTVYHPGLPDTKYAKKWSKPVIYLILMNLYFIKAYITKLNFSLLF